MPIEIKELNIKAYVDDSPSPPNIQTSPVINNTNAIETIITACVEQVMQILKDKEER
jgi:uncharacterized protein YqgV (UPF0045/DUF77 family)